MSGEQAPYASNAIIAAARTQVAEEGLRGLSVRKVAARAGSGRGEVSYQTGAKSDLLASLIADTLAFQRWKHQRWLRLTADLDVTSERVLAAIINAFLDEAATTWRCHSMVLCELVAESARQKQRHADMAKLVAAEESFWRDLQRDKPDAGVLAWAIAHYCRDELPFALALNAHAEYRLLRSATIARLVQRLAPMPERGFATGFEALAASAVTQGGEASAPQTIEGRRSLEIGRAIADLIQTEGVAGITHRSVAAAAGIPKSSIAHHFRTREDMLAAGLAEIHRRLTTADRLLVLLNDAVPDMTLSTATHSIAVEAARNASLVPSVLDLRLLRGEVLRQELGTMFGLARLDFGALQAAGMIIAGAGLALHLAGGEMLLPLTLISEFVSDRE